MGRDQSFQTNANRVNNRDACDGMIRDVLATKPAAYWIHLFEKEGIPCSKVNRVDEALDSLEASVQRGYSDVEAMLADEDLTALRGELRYEALVRRLREEPRPTAE